MGIDGRFIKYLAQELDFELNTGRIQKISQLGKTDFLFVVRANNYNHKLYISLSTTLARINISKRDYTNDYTPGGFCMFLRKYLEGGYIKSIEAINDDRIIKFKIENKNEIGDLNTLYLVIEMFSRYTNMIILDEESKIINAFKHISPFDNADRTIINGVEYPLPIDERLYQNDFEEIKEIFHDEVSYQDLITKIKGISPLFASYVIKQANNNHHRMYDEYINAINAESKPTMYLGSKPDFYYFDVFSKDKKYYDNLSELLDNYYLEASAMERVKQVYKYVQTFTKQELKRKKHKTEKLHKDLKNALENDILRINGDIIITYQNQIKKGDAIFIGYSYELEKDTEIELDRLLSPIQNANKYYLKYKKQKTAISHIEEQIRITQEQVKYLDEIQSQISNTFSLPDLLEIQDELRSNGFLPKKKVQDKKNKPNYDTYYDDLGIMILVGKNNLQNNYLTHKYAKKEYWWFHTKEQTGSHVIVCQTEETLSETTIRTAANLSACFSKSKLSSSVPIDYTKIKYLKKVPGIYGSYVTYTNQKTIYIDPDLEQLNSYKKGR